MTERTIMEPEEIPQEQSEATDLSKLLVKLGNLNRYYHHHDSLHQLLLDVQDPVMNLCLSIDDFQIYDVDEEALLTKSRANLSDGKEYLSTELPNLQRKNEEKAEKENAFLTAQYKKYQSKLDDLNAIRKECDHYQKVLKQKRAKVGEYHQQMRAEVDEMAKWNQALQHLTTEFEINKAKFSEQQEVLKSSSVELDKIFSDCQTEVQQLCDQISTKSTALEDLKVEISSNAVELTALRSKTEDVRAVADRKEQKNREILGEFEAIRKVQNEEIGRQEERMAEQQADHDNAKKAHTDIIDQIQSKFGNAESLDEMAVQGNKKIEAMTTECSELNVKVDDLCRTVQLYEQKIEQLEMAQQEFLQQIDVNMSFTETIEEGEENPNHQFRRQRSIRGTSTDTERSVTKEPIFLQPQGIPKKAKRRQKRQLEIAHNQAEAEPMTESELVVRGADSSISEAVMSTSDASEVTHPDKDVNDYAKMVMFKEHFF